MNRLVKCTQTNHIAFILINLSMITPDTYNTFLNRFFMTLEHLDEDPEVHAVIIAGAGEQPALFHLQDISPKKRRITPLLLGKCITLLSIMKPLTIASINGPVTENIYEIVMACDKRTGTENTTFPASIISSHKSSGVISAQGAKECGLLDRIVCPKELISHCLEQAACAASKSIHAQKSSHQASEN